MSSLYRIVRCTLLAALVAAGIGLTANAQQKDHYLSEKVSEELKKLDDFQNKKLWNEAIRLVQGLLNAAKPDSFDAATLYSYLGRIHYMNNDLHSAIEPIKKAIVLGVQFEYFKPEQIQEMRLLIVQAHFMDAQVKGISLGEQKASYLKALEVMEEWTKFSRKANPDVTNLYAYILFGLAQTNLEVPNKIDPSYIEKAQVIIEQGLTEIAKPKDQLYQLLIACLQQRDNYTRMAEVYEILVKNQPSSKQNWNTLFATYYQLSQDSNPERAFQYSIRAVNTLDRAQALGHMNTPKDNFNRVAIFFNISQHSIATQLLETGLMKGTIEDNLKNWEILAYSFQQVGKEVDAVRVLKEAVKRYPDRGSLYMLMAQSYYSLDKAQESMDASLMAIKVGNLDKPGTAHSFAANMAFQLRKFEEGLVHVEKALSYPEGKKDAQLPKLKDALEEGIREREINKRAVEAQHKNL